MDGNLQEHWEREGYVVVRGLFSEERAGRLRAVSEAVLARWRRENPENGKPGGGPDSTVMRHLNHPGYFRRDRAGQVEMLEAAADEKVLEICRAILGEQPLFRCTSLFMNPQEKSQDGNWHRDSQFHCPDEGDERRMVEDGGEAGHAVQLQVALAPSDDVEVVPGSHRRWDTDGEYAIRRAAGGKNNRCNQMPGALRVALAPGDGLAFNPFGLHRGRYHAGRERRTLMLTYTKSSKPLFDYFSDQPWFLEEDYLEGLAPRSRAFYERFIAQYGEEWKKK